MSQHCTKLRVKTLSVAHGALQLIEIKRLNANTLRLVLTPTGSWLKRISWVDLIVLGYLGKNVKLGQPVQEKEQMNKNHMIIQPIMEFPACYEEKTLFK